MIEPSSIDLVIYHKGCTDGFGAAYAAWKILGNKATYCAAAYGDSPPNVTGKSVAIVDFSYKNDVIKKMIKEAKQLIVIDHHKSAMEDLHDIPNTLFDMNHSGARLSWNFFHPGKSPPKFIDYIEDRDLWKWELPNSKEFSAAFDMVPFKFKEYEKLEDAAVFDNTLKSGSHILKYSKIVVKRICNKAVNRKFEEMDVLVINASHWISEIGNFLAPHCDFAAIWYYDHVKRKTKVSLRAFHEDVDVSEVAKKFKGGGHKKAAGFMLDGDYNIEDIFQNTRKDDENGKDIISKTERSSTNDDASQLG